MEKKTHHYLAPDVRVYSIIGSRRVCSASTIVGTGSLYDYNENTGTWTYDD